MYLTLFDQDIEPLAGGPGWEPDGFRYLNRASRPTYAQLRQFFEAGFRRFPFAKRAMLRNEFRSEDIAKHQGACLELVVHELLVNQGLTNTDLPVQSTLTPDFCVAISRDASLIVEVRSMGNAENALINTLNDFIEGLEIGSLCVHVTANTMPRGNIRWSLVRSRLTEFIQATQASPPPADTPFADLPRFVIDLPDVGPTAKVTLRVRQRPYALAGSNVWTSDLEDAAWFDGDAFQDLIARKAKKYKALELPFVVMVGVDRWFGSREKIVQALYPAPYSDVQPSSTKAMSPFWQPNKNTSIGAVAVLLGFHGRPHPRQRVEVFHNPWAKYPIRASLFGGDETFVEGQVLTTQYGSPLGDLLGLPFDGYADLNRDT